MKNRETAKRLSTALSNAGLTAQELSVKSGVAKASISQYVHGTYAPSNISAGKMAEVLGVSPIWLMGFDVLMDGSMPDKTNTDSLPDNAAAVLDSVRDAFGDRPAEALDMFTRFNDAGQNKLLDEMRDMSELSHYTEKDDAESRLA